MSDVMGKAKPILFSAPMVNALNAGRKTQTRRIVKNYDHYACLTGDCPHETQYECDAAMSGMSPHGKVGDRLWVREQFTYWEDPNTGNDYLVYKADGAKRSLAEWTFPHPIYDHCVGRFGKSIVSIHMPRWASRITLEITDVRVERVQEISEEDAIAEGCMSYEDFMSVWRDINGAESWEANPWCWALSFKVLQTNSGA